MGLTERTIGLHSVSHNSKHHRKALRSASARKYGKKAARMARCRFSNAENDFRSKAEERIPSIFCDDLTILRHQLIKSGESSRTILYFNYKI